MTVELFVPGLSVDASDLIIQNTLAELALELDDDELLLEVLP